jgi:hypothetical protein
MSLYVQGKGVVRRNKKERVHKLRLGWEDNIETVPNRIGCEGKAWITWLIVISNYVTLLIG